MKCVPKCLVVIATPPAQVPPKRKVMCYPIQMSVLSPRLPAVDHQTEGQKTFLRYKGETLDINTPHFHKLVRSTVAEEERLEQMLFNLLKQSHKSHTPSNYKSSQCWVLAFLDSFLLLILLASAFYPPRIIQW